MSRVTPVIGWRRAAIAVTVVTMSALSFSPARAAADTAAVAPNLTAVPGSPFSTGGDQSGASSEELDYSPNGDFLAVANRFADSNPGGGSLTMYSVAGDGALTAAGDPVPTPEPVNALAYDPDGDLIAVVDAESSASDGSYCGGEGCLSTYTVGADGSLSLTPADTVTTDQIESIAFNPQGNLLVVATAFGSLVTFGVAPNGDLSQVGSVPLPTNAVPDGGVAFSPDGQYVAIADSYNSAVDLYSVSGSALTFVGAAPSGTTTDDVAFSPGSDLLAASNRDSGNISMFTVSSAGLAPVPGSPFSDPENQEDYPGGVAFNPGGWLAVTTGIETLVTYDVESDGALQTTGTDYGFVGDLPGAPVFSPSGQFLAVADSEADQIYVFAGLTPPTATIMSPASGGTYTVGQSVPTTFSCADGSGAPGLASCTDSNGASSGTGVLNTATAGTHTYAVTAVSQDGLSSSAQLTYTVTASTTTPTPTPTPSPSPRPSPSPSPSLSGGGSGSAQKVTVSGTTATTTLACAGSSAQTCSFSVSVTVPAPASQSHAIGDAKRTKRKTRARTLVIASTAVTLHGGTKKKVKLTLDKKGRALLTSHHRLTATLEVKQGTKVVRIQHVTFVASKKK